MTELYEIRRRLTLWGRLSRAIGIGYPTMATTERARVGRGGRFEGPSLPDDVMEIDTAVSRSPPHHKLILVEAYTKEAHWTEHAARLRISVDAYYRRKKRAEVYLNAILGPQMN